ncbi:AraC family transcriptional regulator [Streptomyces asiaticus]
MQEFGIQDTLGILKQPWVRPSRTSTGLGWGGVYLSTQAEQPYRNTFDGAPSHLLILHLDGPVTVRRGRWGLTDTRRVPPGGLFLHPAGTALDVELGAQLRTVHVYLSDKTLQQAIGEPGRTVRLIEEFGVTDPLLEQLVLALDGVVRGREPASRTYADQLGLAIAVRLAWQHSDRHRAPVVPARPAGLTDRQFRVARELMDARLSDPLSLEELADAAGLSVSQFARAFKARTGQPPHRYLIRLRVEQAV